ncbi:MAG: hypothetical protein NWR67_00990 [Saprospiraceae bacterium]|jgi:predicted esterase|nr:hypothetical protein [Saprospiraceae bacterium]MDP4819553.1 hypothetical protein [Saprospiraceae bacterium]MDP4999476.1 hypothetical protein [Saprospiraceae bacterium]
MSEPRGHSLMVQKTAHYFTLGEPGEHVRYLWIVCHGYGQLARKFIRKFDFLDRSAHLVIAPEGLSRFYWQGFHGEPVASWMTREDRLDEIRDYAAYLSQLYATYVPRCPQAKIVLLGFSQGVATQLRWMLQDFPAFDHLILYAGMLPDDLDYRSHQSYLRGGNTHLLYGTEDEFLSADALSRMQMLIRDNDLELRVHTFAGNHQVDRTVLDRYFNQYLASASDPL